jgi:hypothetical protein
MSEKHRSLASYFEDPGEISQSWHDQTEGPQSGITHHLTAGQPVSTGLEHKGLGSWMIHPQYGKVYVPDNIDDVFHIEDGKTYHQAESKTWNSNEWGYEEYMQKQVQLPKTKRDGETEAEKKARLDMEKEMRLARRKAKYEAQKRCEAKARLIAKTSGQTFMPMSIYNLMMTIDHQLTDVQTMRRAAIAENKAEFTGKGANTKRDKALHKLETNIVQAADWTSHLQLISDYCVKYGLINTVGMTFPETHMSAGSPVLYLSVAESFLVRAMKMILNGTRHIIRTALKKNDPQDPLSDQEYKFLNISDKASNLHNHKKDNFPKASPKHWPDKDALDKWHKTVRALDKSEWIKLHGKKDIPKHLQEPRTGQQQQKKKHDNSSQDLMHKFKQFQEFQKIMEEGGKHKQGQKGHAGPGKQETASTTTTRKGKKGTAAYMHGYYY